MSDVLPNRPPVRIPTHLDLPSSEEDFQKPWTGGPFRRPDHLDLPDQGDTIVANFREHPLGIESQRVEAASQRVEVERQRVERLAPRLRDLEVDPDTV